MPTNVLFILADDMGAWAMRNAGNSEVITPNLDRLAASGMKFDNFFCASPVCSPARASILTGKMPSCHGVLDWLRTGNVSVDRLTDEQCKSGMFGSESVAVDYLADSVTYTEVLASRGYDCALSGKWHLGNSHSPHCGFNRWKIIARGGCTYFGSDMIDADGSVYINKGYLSDTISENAIKYLREMDKSNCPFYLSVHYTAPHTPWDRNQHPADVWDMYNDCKFESVPYHEPHRWQSPTCQIGHTDEERKTLLRGYYTAITAMDRGIGRILDELEAQGRLDDTLIVFMGDNGMNLGQHGVWGKGNGTLPLNMYDTSLKVPLIISHGDKIPRGTVRSGLYAQYDFLPTLLDYLGCAEDIPNGLPGVSFKDVLLGGKEKGDRIVTASEYNCEQSSEFAEYGSVRMIRGEKYKYVKRYPFPKTDDYGAMPIRFKELCEIDECELYDLENDPDEEINLCGSDGSEAIIVELEAALESWFDSYGSAEHDGRKYPVTGFGQTW